MFDYEVVPDDSLTSADDSGLSVRGRRSEALQPAEVEDRKGVEIRDIDTVLHMTAVIGDPVHNGRARVLSWRTHGGESTWLEAS
jgi:hypothetical protein